MVSGRTDGSPDGVMTGACAASGRASDGTNANAIQRMRRKLRAVPRRVNGRRGRPCPGPAGIPPDSWYLFAVFVATVAGLMIQPLPGGAMVLLGVATTALLGLLSIERAVDGYGEPT